MKKVIGFEIKEATLGDVPVYMDILGGSTSTDGMIQQLLENCVLKDGVPLGSEGVKKLTLSQTKEVVKALVEVNGIDAQSGNG